ncbi:hypothetical protein MNBD_GAMMA12-1197 [hydrothermal vent metagenome]|uniref:Uncharacterized protein n=1 Tax=hydrothermal vent metagenome TaxID=652676 RepID=A0A3B0YVL3_9ZZZZ
MTAIEKLYELKDKEAIVQLFLSELNEVVDDSFNIEHYQKAKSELAIILKEFSNDSSKIPSSGSSGEIVLRCLNSGFLKLYSGLKEAGHNQMYRGLLYEFQTTRPMEAIVKLHQDNAQYIDNALLTVHCFSLATYFRLDNLSQWYAKSLILDPMLDTGEMYYRAPLLINFLGYIFCAPKLTLINIGM